MTLEEQVTQAVARGWCDSRNSHKIMDVDLATAIVAEVIESFSPAPPSNNVRAMPDDVDPQPPLHPNPVQRPSSK